MTGWLSAASLTLVSACSTAPTPHLTSSRPAPLTTHNVQVVAIACAQSSKLDFAAFVSCTRDRIVLTPRQQGVLDCAMAAHTSQSFAECAAPLYGITLSKREVVSADCALKSQGVASRFAACAGTAARGKRITSREQALLGCSAAADDSATKFGACAGIVVFGKQVTREQRIALECAASQGANFAAFTTCAGANLFNVRLNAEQTIAVQCVISTVAHPVAAAACIATRFAVRELKKCASDGYGGAHGCFGDDDAFGRNGWTARTYAQAWTNGMALRDSAVFWAETSPFLQQTRLWWQGSGEFIRNPRQYWAKKAAEQAEVSSTPSSKHVQ